MDKPTLILSTETQFAREVTLGVIYQLPLPIWYSLIPGMFIFDFLRRNRAISLFAKRYLFSRKLALNAAQSTLSGEKQSSINKHIRREIEHWLNAQNCMSLDLANAQKRLVDILVKHYTKLLNADGTDFNGLIGNAYQTGKAFQQHLSDLEKAEIQIDSVMTALKNMDHKEKQKLNIESQQIELRREKILKNVF